MTVRLVRRGLAIGLSSVLAASLAVVGAAGGHAVAAVAHAGPVAAASPGENARPASDSAFAYRATGTPIRGGNSGAAGTLLPSPGLYLDSLTQGSQSAGTPGSEGTKYYSVALVDGVTPWFSATLALPDQRANPATAEVEIEVTSLGSDYSCDWQDSNSSDLSTQLNPLSVGVRLPAVDGPDWPKDCPRAGGTLVVSVSRSGPLYSDVALPLELGYRLEPPANTSGLPSRPAPTASGVQPANKGDVRSFDAGYSFDNAPELGQSRYSDTITVGQMRFARVHLGWGQRLTFEIDSEHVPALGSSSGLTAAVSLFNPMRQQAQADSAATMYTSEFGGAAANQFPMSGTTAVAVRYANRTSDNDYVITPYSISGDYYLVLTVPATTDARAVTVRYTLIVNVSGVAGRGPVYSARDIALPSPSSVTSAPTSAATSTAAGSGAGIGALTIVLAIVVGLALIALLVLLARRRSAGPDGAASGRHTRGFGGPSGPY